MRSLIAAVLSTAMLCVACGSRDEAQLSAPPPSAATQTPPSSPASTATPRIVFLGDSLTAGLGLSAEQAYPSLLQQRLKEDGLPYEVVNAGVSGDTSAGGLSRLDWSLDGNVKVLVVALGGNDALRGLPAEELRKNLTEIIRRAQARHITVVLVGMEAPPNYGHDYAMAFHQVYPSLAKEFHVPLVPFLLQGVGGVARLNQRDGIHPTAEGARILADNVWSTLGPIVERPAS
jgi:acyl-CoA thioesterase I